MKPKHASILLGLLICAIFCSLIMNLTGRKPEKIVLLWVHVIDEKTHAPVSGALLKVLCNGGTVLENKSYLSDTDGVAKVAFFNRAAVVPVNVTKSGYRESTFVVNKNKPQVVLTKLSD